MAPATRTNPPTLTPRPTPAPPVSRRAATPTTALLADLTKPQSEQTLIRAFEDLQGRAVKLIYGRGTGHQGDYGWAHIYNKHVQGIWLDGGTITTYPKTLKTRTPEEVVDLIGRSLDDAKPDDAGNGRRSYVYPVPGTTYDVFTVVGSDGTIITAYPVRHGTKDADN